MTLFDNYQSVFGLHDVHTEEAQKLYWDAYDEFRNSECWELHNMEKYLAYMEEWDMEN